MMKPNFPLVWTDVKFLSVMEKLIEYWDNEVKILTKEKAQLGVLADDPKYLGPGKHLERKIDDAKERLFDATLLHMEAKDGIEAKRHTWEVQSHDLAYFFPYLRNE